MTAPDPESFDPDLIERYRHASATDPVAPSDATRASILAEGRRIADERARAAPPLDGAFRFARRRPWHGAAIGTGVAAALAALLVTPHYWQSSPTAALEAQKTLMPLSEIASPAPFPAAPAPEPSVAPARPAILGSAAAVNSPRSSLDAGIGLREAVAGKALHAAVASGDVAQVESLLVHGTAVELPDDSGRSPLMLASQSGRADVVRLLLSHGANPNAADRTGRTPLQVARQHHFDEIADLLQAAGALR